LGVVIAIVTSGLAVSSMNLPTSFNFAVSITVVTVTVLAALYFIISGNRRFIGILLPPVILLMCLVGVFLFFHVNDLKNRQYRIFNLRSQRLHVGNDGPQ
jgi:hypothetical protein